MMQELEKILEEIKKMIEGNKVIELNGDGTVNRCIIDVTSAWDSIKAIIHDHMNDGWIPAEKRMPEEYGEYLVTIVPSAGCLWAKRIIANFSDLMGIVKKPIFYTGKVGKIDFEDITDMVIAWHPLPEPYQAERSDNHDGE